MRTASRSRSCASTPVAADPSTSTPTWAPATKSASAARETTSVSPPGPGYLFIAGGIGISPIMSMIRQAELLGDPWHLLYLGRSRRRLAYLDELEPLHDNVTVHTADERGRAVIDDWIPDAAPLVYACGPERMLDAVDAWAAPLGRHRVRLERFTARPDDGRAATEFEVEVASSGAVVTVARDSLLTETERAESRCLFPCISRSLSDRLVLDL